MKRYVHLQIQGSGNIREFQVRSMPSPLEYFVIRAQGNEMKLLLSQKKGCQVGVVEPLMQFSYLDAVNLISSFCYYRLQSFPSCL